MPEDSVIMGQAGVNAAAARRGGVDSDATLDHEIESGRDPTLRVCVCREQRLNSCKHDTYVVVAPGGHGGYLRTHEMTAPKRLQHLMVLQLSLNISGILSGHHVITYVINPHTSTSLNDLLLKC